MEKGIIKSKKGIRVHNSELLEGRIPPHSKELEEAVLGACLLERQKLMEVFDKLSERHFYYPEHRAIWRSIDILVKGGTAVDLLTVNNDLRNRNELDEAGGSYYLAQLTNKLASAANLEYYTRILSQKFIQRELIRICGEISTDAYNDSIDALTLISDAMSQITSTITTVMVKNNQDFRHLALQIAHSEKVEGGLKLPIHTLNEKLGGLQPGDLIILAARPGMGKTSLACSLAYDIASTMDDDNEGLNAVGFFSLEMEDKQIAKKFMSLITKVPGYRLRNMDLSEIDLEKLRTPGVYDNCNISLNDVPNAHINQIKARAKQMKAEHNIKALFVDYLQLGEGDGENRTVQIGSVSRGLKGLAKELGIPVIALSQLSREVDKRPNKRPVLADLKDSGSIEQDADVVMFLTSPSYYKMDSFSATIGGVKKDYQSVNHHLNETYFILDLAKNRNGNGTCEIILKSNKNHQLFREFYG